MSLAQFVRPVATGSGLKNLIQETCSLFMIISAGKTYDNRSDKAKLQVAWSERFYQLISIELKINLETINLVSK